MKEVFVLELYKQKALHHALVFGVLTFACLIVIGATASLLRYAGLATAEWSSLVIQGNSAFMRYMIPFGVILLAAINSGQEFEQKTIIQQHLRCIAPAPYVVCKAFWLVAGVALVHGFFYWVPLMLLMPVETWRAFALIGVACLLHHSWLVVLTMLLVSLTRQSLIAFISSASFLVIIDWIGVALLSWSGAILRRPWIDEVAGFAPWVLAKLFSSGDSLSAPLLLFPAYMAVAMAVTIQIIKRTELGRV